MRIIEPYQVTESMLTASNVPENDAPPWLNSASYAVGDRVIQAHGVWECVQAGAGHDPATDTQSAWWVRLGATNRWRAFDGRLGGAVTGGTTISYTIALPRTLNALAFFGLNATTLRIRVTIPGPSVIYDQTMTLSERDLVGNFWEYNFNDFRAQADVIARGVPMPSGATLAITITAGAAARVGEIMLGNDLEIGTTLTETGLGIVDYSKKDRDDWGGIFIVPRPVTSTVRFRFSISTDGAARVQQIMKRITSKLCVFYAVEGEDPFGTTIPGILRDYDLTLTTTQSNGTLEAESLA